MKNKNGHVSQRIRKGSHPRCQNVITSQSCKLYQESSVARQLTEQQNNIPPSTTHAHRTGYNTIQNNNSHWNFLPRGLNFEEYYTLSVLLLLLSCILFTLLVVFESTGIRLRIDRNVGTNWWSKIRLESRTPVIRNQVTLVSIVLVFSISGELQEAEFKLRIRGKRWLEGKNLVHSSLLKRPSFHSFLAPRRYWGFAFVCR